MSHSHIVKRSKNRRKKSSDRRNRKDLYEKHIPCISGAIASIVDKTRNHAFKMHCQELLEVDSSNMIQDAVSSKLFMLTLGHNSESTSYSQVDQNKLHTTTTTGTTTTGTTTTGTTTTVCTGAEETAFADLANHLEDDIASAEWSFLGVPCLRENMTDGLLRETNSSIGARDTAQVTNNEKLQNKENVLESWSRLESMQETVNQKARKPKEFHHEAADIPTPDDDFESLEDNMIFSEFPAVASVCDAIGENRDQRVPCYEQPGGVESNTCRSIIPERIDEIISSVNDDRHFETLGIFM